MFLFKKFLNSTVLGLTLGVLLMGYAVFAFQAPTQGPPGGNPPAPLNTGSLDQTKQGGALNVFGLWVNQSLGVSGGATFGGNLNLQGNKVTNVGSPSASGDVATWDFVNSLPKPAVVLISTVPLADKLSVVISNIPYYPFYEFIISGSLRGGIGDIHMGFNSDPVKNYSGSFISNSQTAPTTGTPYYEANAAKVGFIGGSAINTGPNFLWKGTISNTAGKWKAVVSTGGIESSTNVYTASWRNTATITSITISNTSSAGYSFAPNSWLKLYGRE